jgi:hypothetical protein
MLITIIILIAFIILLECITFFAIGMIIIFLYINILKVNGS